MPRLERDPIARTPGQYARATWRRLRMRSIVALGVLATATALLGRSFGLKDPRFLAAEVALLVTMFVISRYVLPLVERRERGALAEEHVGGLLDQLPRDRWRVIHDATLGRGNVDHIVIGPPGVFTIETKSHPGPVRVGARARRDAGPGAGPGQGDRLGDRHRRGAAGRLQPRVGRPPRRAAQGRARAACADAARVPRTRSDAPQRERRRPGAPPARTRRCSSTTGARGCSAIAGASRCSAARARCGCALASRPGSSLALACMTLDRCSRGPAPPRRRPSSCSPASGSRASGPGSARPCRRRSTAATAWS